jgi:predicted DNA-binding transcriptional regulator YafY
MLAGRRQTPELFDAAQTAIDQNRLLEIGYTDTKLESTTRTIEPMTLVFRWRSWYLFAFCRLREDYRLFRMSRIRNPVLLDRRFVRRDRTIQEYLAELDASGRTQGAKMVLRFDKRMASVAYEIFGDDAHQEADGSVIVRTSMPEDGGLYGFFLSFGTFLEVLEPPHLRGILADAGARIAALYKQPT